MLVKISYILDQLFITCFMHAPNVPVICLILDKYANNMIVIDLL